MHFQITFYKEVSGKSPVEEFLDELERTNSLLYDRTVGGIEKLKNRTYHKEPLSKHIDPGLWEMRIRSSSNILRIIYTFSKGKIIILLHVFIKKQNKTPVGDLEMARKRLKEFKIKKVA